MDKIYNTDKECYKDKICYIIDKIVGVQPIDTFNKNNNPFSIHSVFHIVGYAAPVLMVMSSILLLRNKRKYMNYLIFGYVLCDILNILLRFVLKEPRPTNDWKLLQLGITHSKRFSFDIYGMPSGNAQSCGFLLVFTALVLNDPLVTGIYTILTLITMYQKYLYENHSIKQVVVGLFIGLVFGYLFYQIATNNIIGNIKRRPDDDGPR